MPHIRLLQLKILIFFALILLSCLALIKLINGKQIAYNKTEYTQVSTPTLSRNRPKVIVSGQEFFVEVASSEKEREKGLSGRESLPENGGMLFIFESERRQGFWMKDMVFPIDIIWIKGSKIIHIDKNVNVPRPDTSDAGLPMYFPPIAVDQVLEVNAGVTEKYKIKVGDDISFIKN